MRTPALYVLLMVLLPALRVHGQEITQERENRLHKHNKAVAETDKQWIGLQITALTAPRMRGRGYIKGGQDSAARYILKQFKAYHMKPIAKDGAYAQGFAYPVNIFPGRMQLTLNKEDLEPGKDFIIDASSQSFSAEGLKVQKIDLNRVADSAAWVEMMASFVPDHAYLMENVPTFCEEVLHIRPSDFAAQLPRGLYIIPQHKLTWTVSRDTIPATVFYVQEDALPKKVKKASAADSASYITHQHCENVAACIPGEVADSYVVFTAHYDHLGVMGDSSAVFPGASDNASGVAEMLFIANYFSRHAKPHYTMVFIAFAGEEAGLMGSEFFVTHPMIPLKHIKFLVNIDIMGDATNGITVVNATKFPVHFQLLKDINDAEKYVPQVLSRGPAANSDHFYFTNAGVPSFFIYSNGGPGYYHDVNDKVTALTLNHVVDVASLLVDFTKTIDIVGLVSDTSAADTSAARLPEGTNAPMPDTAPPATPPDGSTPPQTPDNPQQPEQK
jgi:aminopeptidase YwaD